MRKIEAIKLKTDTEMKTDKLSADLRKWLEDNSNGLKPDAIANDLKLHEKANDKVKDETVYLLSFHDDGLVWGKVSAQSELVTSGDCDDKDNFKLPNTPSPKFRVETLQECRLFSERGELYVWRNGNGFKARLIEDSKNAPNEEKEDEAFDENQVLWGTKTENGNDDFTIVADGSEGLRHTFPKKVDVNKFGEKKRPLRLRVRHYLSYDDDGCAYVSLSRLVGVDVE